VEHEKPRPERAPEPKDDPRVVAHRCPFCHEAVRPDAEAWVACAQCLGRQHAACWDENGRCGACSHAQRLEAPAVVTASRRRRPAVALAPFVVLLVVSAAAFVALLSLQGESSPRAEPLPSTPVGPAVAEVVMEAPAEPVEPVERAVSPPPRPAADLLLERQELELARADERELHRLRLAGLDGPGSYAEPFEWLPDRGDAAGVDVARRMAREARERISEREDPLANHVLEAHVQERTGDPDAAISRCNAALDLDPRYGLAWTVRGWARLARGDVIQAELDLRRGAKLGHETTWAHIGLGRVAEARGDAAAAIEAYEVALRGEVLEGGPVDHAGDLRARLERLRASLPSAPPSPSLER
jgi:hypothetical protein